MVSNVIGISFCLPPRNKQFAQILREIIVADFLPLARRKEFVIVGDDGIYHFFLSDFI